MFNFLPKNNQFFDQFILSSDAMVRGVELLSESLDQPGKSGETADAVKQIEQGADKIAHETMEALHKSFITPFKRGEIRRLVFALDDIVDGVNDAARTIHLYEIREVLPEVRELTAKLLAAAREVRDAVRELPKIRGKHEILRHCIETNRLENEGDHVVHTCLARLFKSGLEPLVVIKWREIVEHVEKSLNRCEDVANLLEGLVQEYA